MKPNIDMKSQQTIDDCWNRIGVRGDHSCEKLRDHLHCRNCEVYAAAAGRIMQRALPPDYQRDWAEHFAQPEHAARAHDASVLVFRIRQEWLALPTQLSIAIAEKTDAHRLPHRSGGGLLGIVNVKGNLFPCISLASMFGTDTQADAMQKGRYIYPRTLVMQLGQQACALPVDELHGIERYAKNELQAPPATVNKGVHRYLQGVLCAGGMHIGCLDAEMLGYNLARIIK